MFGVELDRLLVVVLSSLGSRQFDDVILNACVQACCCGLIEHRPVFSCNGATRRGGVWRLLIYSNDRCRQ